MKRLEAINKVIMLVEEAQEDPATMLTVLATAVLLICESHDIPIEHFLEQVFRGEARKDNDEN